MPDTQRLLYLSHRTDADLICLLRQLGGHKFAKAVKESLRMMIRAGYTSKFVDKVVREADPKFKFELKPEAVKVSISFNSKDDDDIRALLNHSSGRHSQVMKNALRYALGPYFTVGYYLKGNEKLCKEYRNRQMFFIEGIPSKEQRIKYVEVAEAPVRRPVAEPVVVEEKKEEPAFVGVPLSTVDNEPEFEDDDILSMLENMM